MKCQIVGCEKAAIIDDDESDDSLCLCGDHQGVEMVHFVEMPEYDGLPFDTLSINRRERACSIYKSALELYNEISKP